MVKKKGKSKRVTLKQKFKMEKRVKEHHRRLKKETNRARKKGLTASTVTRKPKDPGIPNEWPGKEDLLKQIEAAKVAMEQRKEAAQAARKEARKNLLAQRRDRVRRTNLESCSIFFSLSAGVLDSSITFFAAMCSTACRGA